MTDTFKITHFCEFFKKYFFHTNIKMDYNNMKIVDLKALAKEHGLRGYSKLKKAELITFLQNNLPAPRPIPAPRTRPPTPPPTLVRVRPDRPRQTELLRQLEERNPQPLQPPKPVPTLKPFQVKSKRGKETFIEPPMEQPPPYQNRSNV